MVGTAVKRFQTGEQVISPSYPLGQHPPHLSICGEKSVPTIQIPAEYAHEGKCAFFFPFKQKETFHFSILYNLW